MNEKRFYNRETSPLYGFHHSLKVRPLYIRKGLIIRVAWKKKGVWNTFAVVHHLTRQLILYYKISFVERRVQFWMILYDHILVLVSIWINSTKILLVPPKGELTMVLSNFSFFQYCDSHIGLFSISPCKVIVR